jgi:hypothetical protein
MADAPKQNRMAVARAALEQEGEECRKVANLIRKYDAEIDDAVKVRLEKADNHRVSLAQRLAKIRPQCKAAGMTFDEFKTEYVGDVMGRTQLYEWLKIGRGELTVPQMRLLETEKKQRQAAAKPSGKGSPSRTPLTSAQQGALTRKARSDLTALIDAYRQKFPQWKGGVIGDDIQEAMRISLETGIEQPVLIAQREKIERHMAEYDAALAAEHAQPFTPELEQHYTARITNRQLIEGDCERPWQNYFAYRIAHPDDVAPLDDADLEYVGLWTACGRPEPNDGVADMKAQHEAADAPAETADEREDRELAELKQITAERHKGWKEATRENFRAFYLKSFCKVPEARRGRAA